MGATISSMVALVSTHDNFLSIKYGNYNVQPDELEGEVIDWTMQYLEYM